jgi:hypothetical protein
MAVLKESGPVPGEENGVKQKKGKDDDSGRKRKRGVQNVSKPIMPW